MPKRRPRVKSTRKKKPLPIAKMTGVERVLAFDPSSRCCGWSLFDAGELVGFGRFVQQGTGHGERLHNFRVWLLEILGTTNPDLVIYEAPYSGRMRHTFGILSRYAGQIEAAYFEWKQEELPVGHAFQARMVKKILGAKKGANHDQNKRNMILLINQLYGLSLKFKNNDVNKKHSQDDEADAIALNHAWHHRHKAEVPDEE